VHDVVVPEDAVDLVATYCGADSRRTQVTVKWPKSGTTVSSLRGSATDADCVRSVQVALVLADDWITARLEKSGSWQASLGARLPKTKYAVLGRVRDRTGALTDVKFKNRRLGR